MKRSTKVKSKVGFMEENLFLPFNFGALPPQFSNWEEASFVILPVAYDLTTSYQGGTRKGPLAIIEASTHLELYDEELKKETYREGIHTMEVMEPVASGPKEMIKKVREVASQIIEAEKFPVMLGGEHSLTLGMVQALKKRYPKLSVLQLDAHADFRQEYQGTPYHHACVGRRLSELVSLTQLGIRSLSFKEAEGLAKPKVSTFWAWEVYQKKNLKNFLEFLEEEIYITIDLDVLDPSIMPAVGTPEPGGLNWEQILQILRIVSSEKKVVGFDLVELCPLPGFIAPDFLAAKLLYRLLGYIGEKKKEKKGLRKGYRIKG